MATTSTAYLLWLCSGFGALGLHRFYLGRFGTGLLWMFTGGLGGIGAFIDLFTIPSMVRETNLRRRYHQTRQDHQSNQRDPSQLPPKRSHNRYLRQFC